MKAGTLEYENKRRKRILRITLCVVLALYMAYALAEPFMVRTLSVEYESERLPAEFDGYRVAFVSDIHNGPFMSRERLLGLADRINALKPDLVLLGGDYIKGDTSEFYGLFEPVSRIRAVDGVYYVLGNHDYLGDVSVLVRGMQSVGASLLNNDAVEITRGDASIGLVGLDDTTLGSPDARSAYARLSAPFALLLSHNPSVLGLLDDEMKRKTIFGLFGHTHGGQVTAFGLLSYVTPGFLAPAYRDPVRHSDGVDYIITNGFGVTGPPVRFFAPPEVVALTLKRSGG